MALINLPSNVPLSMKVWLASSGYDAHPDPNSISATTLLNSTKQIILSGRVKPEDTAINVNSLAASRIGQAIHSGIENAWEGDIEATMLDLGYPKSVASKVVLNPSEEALKADPSLIPVYMEKRSSKIVKGVIVTGQFDLVMQGRLEDFKSTSTFAYVKDPYNKKFAMQGSIYRWLNPTIITNNRMAVQYIFTNWTQSQVLINPKYPKNKIEQVEMELMPVADVQRFVEDKIDDIAKYQNEPEEKMPECNDEDLWRSAPTYKYYKNPQKKARSTKNFDNMNDALSRLHQDGNVGVVDTVKGMVMKCRYCDAASICQQKDIYILDGTLTL